MKTLLCLIFLFSVCSLNGEPSPRPYNHRPSSYDDHRDEYDVEHSSSIIRPCSYRDLKCIRSVLLRNSLCSSRYGPNPDPLYIKSISLDVPHSNLTFEYNDASITGLKTGRIEEFYINKETGILILEVVIDRLSVYSRNSVVSHYQKGKEAIKVSDYATIDYRTVSLTLTVTNIGSDKPSDTHVYTYVADSNIPFKLGPGITECKDPLVYRNTKQLTSYIGLSAREAFQKESPLLMAVYVQSIICDSKYH